MSKRQKKARCDPDQAKEYLKAHKQALEAEIKTLEREHDRRGVLVPPAVHARLQFIKGAIDRYLSGEAKSLDEAFCVAPLMGPKKANS